MIYKYYQVDSFSYCPRLANPLLQERLIKTFLLMKKYNWTQWFSDDLAHIKWGDSDEEKNPPTISRVPPPTCVTFVRDTQSGCTHRLTCHVHDKKKGQSDLFISRKGDTREHRKTTSYIRNARLSHKWRMCRAVKN